MAALGLKFFKKLLENAHIVLPSSLSLSKGFVSISQCSAY